MPYRYNHIRGIVDELVNNSVRANATDIDVNIRLKDDTIIIRVKDNGKGIPEHRMEEAQKKLNQPRRHEIEDYYGELAGQNLIGTGLSMVGMMTDKAEIKSEPGEGTEITVYIKG